ncbi:MAG: HNH endonuclease [Actinomycetales bacterium]|nr:HNH endonuclease [Actinomycetales bacterium]
MNWVTLLGAVFDGLRPFLPLLVGIAAFLTVLRFPMPGRGPGRQGRDPWRSFKFAARRRVVERAGGRCEATSFLVWGRCNQDAVEVDHVYPWSRGGATIVSNGQALCRHHNRAKSSWPPPWWYIGLLERRRRGYFPADEDVRVSAAMTDADRAARAGWAARKSD